MAGLAQVKQHLEEQLELAFDIEDWPRVRQLQDRLESLDPRPDRLKVLDPELLLQDSSAAPPGQSRGTVKAWIEERGMGFIVVTASGEDCFVHRTELMDCQSLVVGSRVTFLEDWDHQKNKRIARSVYGGNSGPKRGAAGGGLAIARLPNEGRFRPGNRSRSPRRLGEAGDFEERHLGKAFRTAETDASSQIEEYRGKKAHSRGSTSSMRSSTQLALSSEAQKVIELNKNIKHFLQRDQVSEAWAELEQMRKDPSTLPNSITYNEFLGYFAKKKNMREVFRILREMMPGDGVKPTRITGSIILKSLDDSADQGDIDRAVGVINDVIDTEGVDDILMSSIAESTVRIGYRGHKVYMALNKILEDTGYRWSVQTCGSLIRAHGYAKDVSGVWACWESLLSRGAQPTTVTTGCMVEQLVLNNKVEEAHRVIRYLDSTGFTESINAVVYNSLLKGYAMQRSQAKVWALYQEMKSRGLELKVETYNALVGAFADCNMIDWVPGLFAEMYASGIAPSVRTFTRLAKGFCSMGEMKKAEGVMKEMVTSTGLVPDEIFYNTILDAYAQRGDLKGGNKLLKKMREDGFGDTKYTKTILRKLHHNAEAAADGEPTPRGPGRPDGGSSAKRVPPPPPPPQH